MIGRVLRSVPFLLLTAALAGCPQGIQSKVSCTKDSECVKLSGTLLPGDAGVFLPKCCTGICLLPSGGCESGYRYLTVDPNNAPFGGYGNCVAAAMCPMPDLAPPQPVPDLSMSSD
jgi:hypothetical protein